MSLFAAAPIRVNETVVRIIAAFVVIFGIVTIYTSWVYVPIFLTIDFFLRGFTGIRSPFAFIANLIAQTLGLKEKFIFAPPKRFAAQVGFVFSLTIATLLLLQFVYAAMAVAIVLLACAILESVFGICVGCYVYDWFVAPILNKIK